MTGRPNGFVLAGGRSRRMGFDKARAWWDGVPLAIAVARSLEAVCDRVVLVRRVDDGLPWRHPDGRDVEIAREPASGEHHPLWGVVTALEAARTPFVLVAPCDVPGISPASWTALLARAPSVACDAERPHPLVAALPRELAGRARALAAAGAPAHALTRDLVQVQLPEAELVDHDDPASLGEGPIRRLLARSPVTDPAARRRIAEGERQRLLCQGIIDPTDDCYFYY